MDFLTGIKEKETVDLAAVTAEGMEGKTVKLEGTVHTIRNMGEVAFVILRRRDGLLQCVYEEGVTEFELKTLKDGACVEVEGSIRSEKKAPHGVEVRLSGIRVLSEPAAPLPPRRPPSRTRSSSRRHRHSGLARSSASVQPE